MSKLKIFIYIYYGFIDIYKNKNLINFDVSIHFFLIFFSFLLLLFIKRTFSQIRYICTRKIYLESFYSFFSCLKIYQQKK